MMKNSIRKISFVIPCYRSERTIDAVVEEVILRTGETGIPEYEIILVNDCSPDHVWSVIQKLSEADPHILGISLAKNFGQHAALLAGYAHATGDIVVSLDDDGQTPIDELDLLLEKIEAGYDVVYAYYEEIKQTAFRRFGTFMAEKMGEFMIGAPKGFKGSSFYVARKYVIDEIVLYKNPYPYLSGLVLRVTRNITNVMTHHRKRIEGTSGYHFRSLLALWVNGLTAFSVKPLRIGTYGGICCAAAGFIFALSIIIRKISHPSMAVGWPSTMSVILIIGGLLLIMLGLIGEYIGRIYICMNDAPQYVVREMTQKNENAKYKIHNNT